jgi:hypothetical protein
MVRSNAAQPNVGHLIQVCETNSQSGFSTYTVLFSYLYRHRLVRKPNLRDRSSAKHSLTALCSSEVRGIGVREEWSRAEKARRMGLFVVPHFEEPTIGG